MKRLFRIIFKPKPKVGNKYSFDNYECIVNTVNQGIVYYTVGFQGDKGVPVDMIKEIREFWWVYD